MIYNLVDKIVLHKRSSSNYLFWFEFGVTIL